MLSDIHVYNQQCLITHVLVAFCIATVLYNCICIVFLFTDPAGCSLEGFHVNAVAAAVGAFFRELPTPLIPKDRYTDLLRTIGELIFLVLYIMYCLL